MKVHVKNGRHFYKRGMDMCVYVYIIVKIYIYIYIYRERERERESIVRACERDYDQLIYELR